MPDVNSQYCDITLAGVERDCTGSVGGVARVAIAPAGQIKDITVDPETGIITAITPVEGVTKPFLPYWQKKATAVFNTAYTPSDTSSGLHQNDLAFQIQKMSAAHRAEYLKLVSGETLVLFKDNNGFWWLLGTPDLPAEATAGDGSTGTALTDFNGHNVTLSTTDKITPPEVDPELAESLIASLIAPAA